MSKKNDKFIPAQKTEPVFESAKTETTREFEFIETEEEHLTNLSARISERMGSIVDRMSLKLLDPNLDDMAKWKLFHEAMNDAWPENDHHPIKSRYFLRPISDEFANINVLLEPRRVGGEVGLIDGKPVDIVLGLGNLLQAKNPIEFAEAKESIFELIYHELEHLYYPGTEFESGDPESYVKYASNPGEMRAYAKQFALRYTTFFPGQPFDLERMRSICESVKNLHGENYFIKFALPDRREKYRHVADVLAVHNQVVRMTSVFVEHLNTVRNAQS